MNEIRKKEILDYLKNERELRRQSISRGESYEIEELPGKPEGQMKSRYQNSPAKRRAKREVSVDYRASPVSKATSWIEYEKRLSEMAKPKTEKIKERENLKKEIEKQDFDYNCTFKPQISEFKFKSRPEEAIEERLLRLGEEKRHKQESLIKEKQSSEVYTFQPEINSFVSKPPLHTRIDELQKHKAEDISRIRMKQELNQNLTFAPRINPNATKLAKNRKSRPEKKQVTYIQRDSTPPRTGNFQGFLERQEAFSRYKEENSVKRASKNQEKESCSFQPEICEHSRKLSAHQDLSYERMSGFEYSRREQTRVQKEHDYYSKFTFTPKINKISKSMGESLYDIKIDKSDFIEREELSFQPQINPSNAQSEYKNPEQIMKNIKKNMHKKEKYARELKNKEEEKMKDECTFQPKINKNKATTDMAVPVAGLNRFLEVRELANNKKREQKEREDKVFGIKNTGYWDSTFTAAKPFNLSQSNRDSRIAELHQEFLEIQMKECTFRPKTVET